MNVETIKYYAEDADKAAHEALSLMIKRTRENAEELQRYLNKLECEKSQKGKADILSWALNAAAGLAPNLRTDLVGAAIGKLAYVDGVREAAGLGDQNQDCQMVVSLKLSPAAKTSKG